MNGFDTDSSEENADIEKQKCVAGFGLFKGFIQINKK